MQFIAEWLNVRADLHYKIQFSAYCYSARKDGSSSTWNKIRKGSVVQALVKFDPLAALLDQWDTSQQIEEIELYSVELFMIVALFFWEEKHSMNLERLRTSKQCESTMYAVVKRSVLLKHIKLCMDETLKEYKFILRLSSNVRRVGQMHAYVDTLERFGEAGQS